MNRWLEDWEIWNIFKLSEELNIKKDDLMIGKSFKVQ